MLKVKPMHNCLQELDLVHTVYCPFNSFPFLNCENVYLNKNIPYKRSAGGIRLGEWSVLLLYLEKTIPFWI